MNGYNDYQFTKLVEKYYKQPDFLNDHVYYVSGNGDYSIWFDNCDNRWFISGQF